MVNSFPVAELLSFMPTIGAFLQRLSARVKREKSSPDQLWFRGLSIEERKVLALVKSFTMTDVESILTLIDATRHVVENRIHGDMVECGVWRGGSMMAIAATLLECDDTSRDLYLYDTFEGMPVPSDIDVQFDGQPAKELYDKIKRSEGAWCYANIQDVARNLTSTGYPEDKTKLIQGKVEETIPARIPETIALLRLDTDWYSSTFHELEYLYPRLASGGVLIIDDYGHWRGAKRATDEYFSSFPEGRPFFHRINYSGRLVIKP